MFSQQNSNAPQGSFGTSNPVFGASSQQSNAGGFGGITSGQNVFGSNSGQPPAVGSAITQPGSVFGQSAPSFGGTTNIGVSGFSGTGNPSFGLSNQPFGGSSATAAGSAFGTTAATGLLGTTSTPMFGSPAATTTITPSFGSLSSGTPAFGQTGQSSFGSQNTAFGGSQFSPLSTAATSTTSTSVFGAKSNPTFGTGAPIFGATGAQTFGQAPFGGSSGSTFGAMNTEKPSPFTAVTTAPPVFGAVGSSPFQAASTTSLFNSGNPANVSGSIFGSGSGIFGAASSNSGVSSTSVFTTSTSGVIFSTGQGFGTSSRPFGSEAASFASGSTMPASMAASSVTSGSVFGCISSTGQQMPASVSPLVSVQNTFQRVAPGATSVATGVFGSKPVTSSDDFKSITDSGANMDESGKDAKLTAETVSTKDEDDQKESQTVRSLFTKSAQGEKKLAKSGLFLAAISEIAATKEQKNTDERKVSASRTDEKQTDTTDNEERKTAPASSGRRIIRRRSTLEDVQKKVSIIVRSIDPSCNNKEFLKRYFQKYGAVKRVYVNPMKESATIHFTTHDAAQAAMQSTRILKPGTPRVQIFWGSYTPRKESTDSQVSASETKTQTNEVDEELKSMQGTSDLYEDNIKILEHPKDLNEPDRALEKSTKSKLRVRTSSRSRIRDVKDRSTVTKLKPLKKPIKSSQSKPPGKDKPKKGADFISLKSLANCIAKTAAERVEVLENRDKILRMVLESKKHIYLATAEALVGTCPDMCPEKERYLREVRRHLSVYEIVPGSDVPGQNPECDHSRAVKEYSRSSADQEMPLPHELRPPPVLSMTMDYLMNDIMDTGGDGKWADWYEYLWSRTRSLRKDITQQDLCDCTSVSVIEKNCRFHIYCAERLCEEDMSTFDEKINNENLTKCLQTLKQMYSDLEKKGIFCKNEPEFRAYVVLMNLNNGDTLREVQQLREEVRESDPVKFATKVYSAVNCNNYIKFFKLVQMAPFLYACILHRYFNQLRSSALRTMLKAYRWPGQSPQYPLSDLTRLLQFENESEAVSFCHHHGFSVEDGKILMDRRGFVEPDTALEPRRAVNLIESKQRGTVGEVVNGGPLPPFQLHQPHSSFDENGRFIPTDINIAESDDKTADTVTSAAETVKSSPAESAVSAVPTHAPVSELAEVQPKASTEQPPPPPQPQISNEVVREIAKQLFIEVIHEHVIDISQSVMRDVTVYLGSASWIYDELQDNVLSELYRQTAETAVKECEQEKREMIARHKAELSILKAKATDSIVDELITNVVSQECHQLAEEEYSDVKEALHAESERRVTEVIACELVDRSVQEEACLVAELVFEVDIVERLEQMEEAAAAVRLLVMAKFMNRWKNRYAARQSLKCSILTFPPAPSMKTPSEQVNSLIPESRGIVDGTLHLGLRAYATLDSAALVAEKEEKLKYQITSYKYWKRRGHRLAWSPLCLGSILYARLHFKLRDLKRNSSEEPIYWKLILSLPDVGPNSSIDDDYTQSTIMWCDWLRAKFTKGTVPSTYPESRTELLSLYTTHVHNSGTLRVCVRLVKGFPDDEEDEDAALDRTCLLGTSAVMFYVGEADPDHGECYVAEVQSRLQHLLESLPKCCPVPLVIMCPVNSPVTENNIRMELFLQEDMISGYRFVTVGEDVDSPEYHNKLIDSLHWTTEHYPEPPLLASGSLLDIVEDVVSCRYFNTAYQALAKSQNLSQCQIPELLISFYNHVICHLADAISDSALQDLSWPIAEFSKEDGLPAADWNTPDQLDFLRQTVLSLKLPEYKRPSEDGNLEWTELLDHVWNYVAAVADDGDGSVRLFSRVKYLLNKLEKRFGLESTATVALCLLDWQMIYVNIPWIDIVQACYEARLCQIDWADIGSEEEAPLMAHYFQSKLDNFTAPEDWLTATRELNLKAKMSPEKITVSSIKRKLNVSLSDEQENLKTAKLADRVPETDLAKASTVTVDTENTAHALNCLIAEEKQKSEQLEAFLQKSLRDDDCIDHDINQSFGSPDVFFAVKRKSFLQSQNQQSPSFRMASLNSTSANKSGRNTITDDVNQLDAVLKSEKQADKIFEMWLKSFLVD